MYKKNILTFILLFFIFSPAGLTQPQWYEQSSGGNRELTDVCFVDQNNGWISGWTGTMLHTTDGGATWTPQNILPNNAYWSVFFTDLLNGWATGYAGKIVHSTDGGETWVDQTSPINTELYESYFINPDIGWIVGGDTGGFPSYISHRVILYTSNGGDTWIEQYGEAYKAPLSGVFFPDQNIGYASGQYGLVMKTTDGGTTWLEDTIFTYYDFDDIFFLSSTTGWVIGEYLDQPQYAAIFKTTDGGNTWIESQLGFDESLQSIYFVDNMKGWAVGGANSQGLVYYTSDGGTNWIQQNIPSTEFLYRVFFADENNGWASGHLGTIISTVNPVPVELTAFTATADENNVALTWNTATETNNSGFEIQRKNIDWERIGFVEGNGTTTKQNSYSFVEENLKAGTYQYRLKQIDYDGSFEFSDIVEVEILTPLQFSLEQNYPNPFNPSTTIQYTIPVSGIVNLKVFNSIGEEVTTLVDEYKDSGVYDIEFSANGLSSGIYFYKVQVGSFVDIKKMVIMK